jgi:hypothetical protein
VTRAHTNIIGALALGGCSPQVEAVSALAPDQGVDQVRRG